MQRARPDVLVVARRVGRARRADRRRQGSLHWIRLRGRAVPRRGYCMVSPSAGGVPDLLAWMAERGRARPARRPGRRWRRPAAIVRSWPRCAFAIELDATEVFLGGQARHVPFGEVLAVPEVADARNTSPAASSGPVGRERRGPCPGTLGPVLGHAVPGAAATAVGGHDADRRGARRAWSHEAMRPRPAPDRRRRRGDPRRAAGRHPHRRLHPRARRPVRHPGAGRPRRRGHQGADRGPLAGVHPTASRTPRCGTGRSPRSR